MKKTVISIVIVIIVICSCDNNFFDKERNNHQFAYIKGGTFEMGSDSIQPGDCFVHTVTLSDFEISKYEVTYDQFIVFLNDLECDSEGRFFDSLLNMAIHYTYIWEKYSSLMNYLDTIVENGAIAYNGKEFYFKGDFFTPSDQCPVIVNWFGANAYCKWIGGRLPTEAEWEYAARGGVKSKGYSFSGSNKPDEVAWSAYNSKVQFHPVGLLKPNELGLYDMSGNISEYCFDYYQWDYYNESPGLNPKGPENGNKKVIRGGSIGNYTLYCRPTWREGSELFPFYVLHGFRVARNVD